MPYQLVPSKFKHGKLHSGSKNGPLVKNRKQMLAIMMSEKKKGIDTGPSSKIKNLFKKK